MAGILRSTLHPWSARDLDLGLLGVPAGMPNKQPVDEDEVDCSHRNRGLDGTFLLLCSLILYSDGHTFARNDAFRVYLFFQRKGDDTR